MSCLSRIRRESGKLRTKLLVLVLAPLLAVSAVAGWEIKQRAVNASAALHAEQAITAAAQLSAVRRGLVQELLPGLARATVKLASNPVLKAASVPAVSLADLGLSGAQIEQLRGATDHALAAMRGKPLLHTLAPAVATTIAQVRQDIDSGIGLVGGFDRAVALIEQLAAAQDNEVGDAVSAGAAGATGVDAQDLGRVSQLVQLADLELPRLAGSLFPVPGSPAEDGGLTAKQEWLRIWGGYYSAYRAVLDSGSKPITAALEKATGTLAARAFDSAAARAADNPDVVTTAELVQLYRLGQARSVGLRQVLDLAAARAVSAASAQRHSAMVSLWSIAALLLALLAACAFMLWRVLRSVIGPLRSLSASARKVSHGVLDEVPIDGPEEVRTAAEGLAAAVANLRNIEAQAVAISAGDLDNDILRGPLPGPLGRVVHGSVETIIAAIHDRDAARTDLDYRTAHDALTGLINRAQAMATIERSLHRAQRAGAMTALMFVDLDHFKVVNHDFGHETGDAVLVTTAHRMTHVVRGGDMVARIGGDEFLVLLEDVAGSADAIALAERVVTVLAESIPTDGRDVHVGASVGLAVCADGGVDAERLLGEAEAAARRAKRAGRGRVGIVDDTLRAELAQRAELDDAIVHALQQNEFVLHYQPIVFLPSGRVYGFEALIRWQRPGHGLVMPDDFIPAAEQSRRINDIGRWTLQEALGQLARWHAETGNTAVTVGVNISGRHLASPELLHDVRAALAAAGVAPSLLVVEITETVIVTDPIAMMNLTGLREMGVRVALDDFGTGFTSIRQLRHLPVDCIKIDRSFIVSTDPAERKLVQLMTSAALAFGLVVIAEGIEEPCQLATPIECGVIGAQGYYFARPVPAAQARELIRAGVLPLQRPSRVARYTHEWRDISRHSVP